MENNQTENLDLTLIQEGETNWGSAINNNFIKIDADHQELKNRIDNIKYSQIENMGLFIDSEAEYIDFTYTESDKKLKIGNLIIADGSATIDGTIVDDYTTFNSGRCFYVWCGSDGESTYTGNPNLSSPYNMGWKNGDILIIYLKYIDGEYQAVFKKLSQVLGKKYLNLYSYVYHMKNFGSGDGGTYQDRSCQLDKNIIGDPAAIGITNFPNLFCNIYKATGDSTSQKIWEKINLDYTITRNSTSRYIGFTFNADEDLSNSNIIAVITYGDN